MPQLLSHPFHNSMLPSRSSGLRWTSLPGVIGLGLLLVFLLAGVGFFWTQHHKALRSEPFLVLLVDPSADSGAQQEAQALNELVEDCLDFGAAASVARLPELPEPSRWAGCKKEGLVLRLGFQRTTEGLRLLLTSGRSSDLRSGIPITTQTSPSLPPFEAFQWLFRTLKLKVDERKFEMLLPRKEAAFWALVAGMSAVREGGSQVDALLRLEALATAEPLCATPRIVYGEAKLRMETGGPQGLREGVEQLERGLALAPNHPRALHALTRIRTETGTARPGLGAQLRALQERPWSLRLLRSLAYSARYVGLLDLALRASDRADQVYFHPEQPNRIQIDRLHGGQVARYESSLWFDGKASLDGAIHFQRAHLALVQGRREQASEGFRLAMAFEGGSQVPKDLSRAFHAVLQSSHGEALKVLEEISDGNRKATLPDGEVAFHLAEAYALAEEPSKAMDLAGRAFAQGFGCATWYEQDPLLASLRSLPRWQALMQKVRERQALMEEHFPPSSWGFR